MYLYNRHDYNKLSYNNWTELELTQMKHKNSYLYINHVTDRKWLYNLLDNIYNNLISDNSGFRMWLINENFF